MGSDLSEVNFLDRHIVDCSSKYLTRVKLVTESSNIQYDYRCCDLTMRGLETSQLACRKHNLK